MTRHSTGSEGDERGGRNSRGTDPELSTRQYIERIGLDPGTVTRPDHETLARLQRAHVRTVPFENLDIVGGPGVDQSRIDLSVPQFYEKIVERERGGYCYELNGLFHWLLAELGYDVGRVAARVVTDGDASPPANHHTNVVELDRRYVVDVGMGIPTMRRPTPLDGSSRTDEVGVEWRIADSDRPDAEYRSMYRTSPASNWSTRFVFDDVVRDLDYFRATNDYLQTAPESPFTDGRFATIATADGHRKLGDGTLTKTVDGQETERSVPDGEWLETVRREFGVTIDSDE